MSVGDGMLEKLFDARLIAVVRGESRRSAVEVSEALIEGGVTGIEITFTTPDAALAIRDLDSSHGDSILLGAGTITCSEHVALAAEAGARFLVSPGFSVNLTRGMRDTGLACLPGVLTPSEVMAAIELGCEAVKLFPGSFGGAEYLSALRGPFPEVSFVPTGGVSEKNVAEWFRAGAVALGAGGSLAPPAITGEKHRLEVVETAASFVRTVREE